jgi:hypothetical protein
MLHIVFFRWHAIHQTHTCTCRIILADITDNTDKFDLFIILWFDYHQSCGSDCNKVYVIVAWSVYSRRKHSQVNLVFCSSHVIYHVYIYLDMHWYFINISATVLRSWNDFFMSNSNFSEYVQKSYTLVSVPLSVSLIHVFILCLTVVAVKLLGCLT